MVGYHVFLVVKQTTAYEIRISDWSSYVCSSDLPACRAAPGKRARGRHGSWRADRRRREWPCLRSAAETLHDISFLLSRGIRAARRSPDRRVRPNLGAEGDGMKLLTPDLAARLRAHDAAHRAAVPSRTGAV